MKKIHIAIVGIMCILVSMVSVNAVSILSPESGIHTTKSDVTFEWGDYQEAFDNYKLTIYNNPSLTDPATSATTTDNYLTINNIETGKYYAVVEVRNTNVTLSMSDPIEFTIEQTPDDFTIDIDTSRFEDDGFVILDLNLPLGSETHISITGATNPIIYNPKNIQNPELRIFLSEEVDYDLTANMTYYDHTDTFESSFSLENSQTTVSTQSTTTSNSDFFNLTIITREENQSLSEVDFSYDSTLDGLNFFNFSGNLEHCCFTSSL